MGDREWKCRFANELRELVRMSGNWEEVRERCFFGGVGEMFEKWGPGGAGVTVAKGHRRRKGWQYGGGDVWVRD